MKSLSTISNSSDGVGVFLLVGLSIGWVAYDLKNGFEIRFHPLPSSVLSIESDGRRIAVGTDDGSLYIYQSPSSSASSSSSSLSTEAMGEFLLSAELVGVYKDHVDGLTSIKIDERKIITGSRDNCIKVWDLGENDQNQNQNQNQNQSRGARRLYSLLGGSLQARPGNPAHPRRKGCSGIAYDETKIVGAFNSLVRVYSFEEKVPK